MGRGKTVSNDLRAKIVQLHANCSKQADIAQSLGINRSIVCRMLKNNAEEGTPLSAKNLGRPRKTTCRIDREIVRLSKQNPFLSAAKIASNLA